MQRDSRVVKLIAWPTVQICGIPASCSFANWSVKLLRPFDCARTLEEEAAPELGGHMTSSRDKTLLCLSTLDMFSDLKLKSLPCQLRELLFVTLKI